MVQIALVPQQDSNQPEWTMIEFQGVIESNSLDLCGLELGNVSFKPDGSPILVIGHNRLEGKIVKLNKPLAVLRPVKTSDNIVRSYDVLTLIKQKWYFKTRPQPIISAAPVDSKTR